MVKIAIAGGAGNVAQEIIDVLAATNKHEILILTRKDVAVSETRPAIKWVKTTYKDVNKLADILEDVHTVLSFIAPHLDQDEAADVQKNLIDASVKASVKRFAPSEWATSGLEHQSWYRYKATTRAYLADLNKDGTVLEYCLFQPGLFTNYFTHPYKSTKHVKSMELPVKFAERKALVRDGGEDDCVTLTTVRDLANVVAQAIEYHGKWPVVGGLCGTRISFGRLIALGEDIRGGAFATEKLKTEELEAGTWKSSWLPKLDHPSVPPEHVEAMSRTITTGFFLAAREKSFVTSDAWNKLLPEFTFQDAEVFLREAWSGKP